MDYFRTMYEKCYDCDEYYWGLEPASFLKDLIQVTGKNPSELRVLDIGCGEGKDAVYMAECGCKVSAFDITESGIRKTKMLAEKRGVEIDAINFFSFPYTSERAKEKVMELASILAQYTSRINLYIVPFTEIQLEIRDKTPEEHMTLLMRRFMMKISEKIARRNGSIALITGESVGQVASQTLAALNVTNAVCGMPVLRPLIGMDKTEIIDRAYKIGTFETSILPYEDCCTVFTPAHPTTNPKLANIEKSESRLDFDGLVAKALEGVEKVVIYPKGVN